VTEKKDNDDGLVLASFIVAALLAALACGLFIGGVVTGLAVAPDCEVSK